MSIRHRPVIVHRKDFGIRGLAQRRCPWRSSDRDRNRHITSTRLVSRDGGIEPRWAHSGRELFYKSRDRLMVVDVTPGATLTFGSPRELFSVAEYRSARNRPQYDVTPDDRRFVMIRELVSAADDVVYVENWFPELLEKVGNE